MTYSYLHNVMVIYVYIFCGIRCLVTSVLLENSLVLFKYMQTNFLYSSYRYYSRTMRSTAPLSSQLSLLPTLFQYTPTSLIIHFRTILENLNRAKHRLVS